MPYRSLFRIVSLAGLHALGGCAALNLGSGGGEVSLRDLEDPARRAGYVAAQAVALRGKANDTVVRRLRAIGQDKCLTGIETSLMVADFNQSLDADLAGIRAASERCCQAGAREDATVIANRLKDLDIRLSRYQDAPSESRVFAVVNAYGPQASAPRASDVCQARLQKITDFAGRQQGKPAALPRMTGIVAGPDDPAGIVALQAEFEKRIGDLQLYQRLIGPVSPPAP